MWSICYYQTFHCDHFSDYTTYHQVLQTKKKKRVDFFFLSPHLGKAGKKSFGVLSFLHSIRVTYVSQFKKGHNEANRIYPTDRLAPREKKK